MTNNKLQKLIENTCLCVTELYGSQEATLLTITRKELIEMLVLLRDGGVDSHIIADHLLLSYIGDEEIKDLFIKLNRWYD